MSIIYIFTGINIFRKKEIFLLIENSLFIILYSLIGSLFFGFYYKNAFTLYINGNGGFIGVYMNQTFLNSLILINKDVFYYFLIFLVLILFLFSINFNLKKFNRFILKIFSLVFSKNNKNYTEKSKIINKNNKNK